MSRRIRVWIQRFTDRGTLQLQWRDPLTRRKKTRSSGTADPDEAEDARVDLEADLNAGRYQQAVRLSWPLFRQRFEAEYVAALRANTRAGYRRTLDLFEGLARHLTVAAVAAEHVSRFAALLRNRGDAATTIHLRLQQLQTALRWALAQSLLAAVPLFPAVKVPKKLPQPVPAELFERLAAAADQPLRTFLDCGWLAGLRLEEAFELEWENPGLQRSPWVDFRRQRIWFPAEAVKGGADQWVPLDPQLAAALLALPRLGPTVFRFTTRQGRPISVSGVGWRIVRLAKKVGVRLSMRSLRRGFVSRYAARFPAQVVQKLARHAKIETTLKHYAAIDDAVERAVLGDILVNTQAQTMKNPGK